MRAKSAGVQLMRETATEILARFDAERARPRPSKEPGIRYEHLENLVRAFGAWSSGSSYYAVVFARLTPDNADAVIAEQVSFFRSVAVKPGSRSEAPGATARAIEWKVYGHDLPADLGTRLAAAGFEPDETETLMVFDLAEELHGSEAGSRARARTAVDIRRVTDAAGFADFIAAGSAAFARDVAAQMARIGNELRARLGDNDPTLGLYVAYADGRPVASARLECPRGSSFAGLWGGGTVPEYRGRGIYRALVQARADEARRRGYRYLRVDARETSRPILERLGFIVLTHIIEWKFPLPVPASPG